MQAALQAQQVPADQAAALAAQASIGLASLMSKLPVGSITLDNELVTDQSFIATYRAGGGKVHVRGIDLAVEHQLTGRVTVEGTYSFLSKIVFPEAGGEANPLMSNSPKHRATGTGRYRNDTWGFGAEARVRYADAFPVNSGVFNSLGIPPNNPGTFLYERPGTSIQFDLGVSKRLSLAGREFNWSLFGQNVLDADTPTFVGVPAPGRMVSTRLQYVF
jgi:iron complex outermembrane receptor protein